MKKRVIAVFIAVFVSVGCCFADSLWHFSSGSADLGYKFFYCAEVRNYSGWEVTANGQVIFDKQTWKFFDSFLTITSNAYNANNFRVLYNFDGSTLIVTIIK